MKKLLLVALLFLWTISASAQSTTTPGEAVITNRQAGTTYTVKSSDRKRVVIFTNAGTKAVTLPIFSSGWYGWFYNTGAGAATITPASGTIGGSATLVLAAGKSAKVVRDSTGYVVPQLDLSTAERAAIGGGGAGTVTSVSGTANQISVASGTSTPVLTLSSTIVTPGTLAVGAGSAITSSGAGGALGTNAFTSTAYAPLASPTFTGTVTIPTPFTLGAVSVLPTGTELNFVDGVTSAIQPQLDAKQATITFGTGVQTALGVNVGSAGAPVLFNGAGGTPSSLTGTNITGTAAGLTAGNVTTNANLTGHVTSVGNAAVLGSFTFAQLNTAVSDADVARTDAGQTFTGVNIFTSPKILTDISDTNGNELIKFTATGSAVNELTVTNAAASGEPSISATGGDTDVSIVLTPKGAGNLLVSSGVIQIGGTSSSFGGLVSEGGSAVLRMVDASNANYGILDVQRIRAKSSLGGSSMVLLNTASGMEIASVLPIAWSGTSNNAEAGKDLGLSRISAGVLGVGNGTQADFSGALKLTTLTVAGLTSGRVPVVGSGGLVGDDSALLYDTSLDTLTTKIFKGSQSDTNTSFGGSGSQTVARWTNTSATTNNWVLQEFDDAAGSLAAAIGVQFQDQTNHYGAIAFATRGAGGFLTQFVIGQTGILTLNTTNYNTCTALTTTAAVLGCTVSDERVKNHITPFSNGLDAIRKINPITFQFSEGTQWYKGGRTELGVSAQNLKAANPLLATSTGNATDLLQPEPLALHAVEIDAIKELDAKVTVLTARLTALEAENERLRARP